MTTLRTAGLLFLAFLAAGCVAAEKKKGRYGEGDHPSAHDATKEGWPVNPEYQRTRIQLVVQDVETLLHHGKVAEARRRLDELPPLDLEDGRLHLLFARITMAEGQPQEVEWHLDEAAVLMPLDGRVDLMRATFREVYGDWAAARDAYAEAARKMPEHTESITAQARVLLAMGAADKALELLEREMDSRPLSGELLRTAGFVRLSAGLFDDAARDFRDAQDLLSPDGAPLETMYLALARAGRYDDVVSLVRGVDLGELSPLAQYTVGHAALLAEEAGLAVEAFQHWITHDRSNPDSWLDLARAHFQDGQYDAAFEAVSKVLRVRPGHVDSLVLLGHIRSRVGQYASAMATYREAARLGADGVDLAPVMLRLVDVMEQGVSGPSLAAAETPPAVAVVAFGASQPDWSTQASSPPAAQGGERQVERDPSGAHDITDPLERDRMALAELMAGTQRVTPAAAQPQAADAVVVPEDFGRLLPDLPDAGPASEEGMYGFELLEMPLAAMGAEEG